MISLYSPLASFIQNFVVEDRMIYSEEIGLCATCNNVATCFHRRRYDQPVWQCEEFDDSDLVVGSQTNNGNSPNMNEAESLSDNDKNSSLFIGLCSNCKSRNFCTYPKPEGGVWRCEEYE